MKKSKKLLTFTSIAIASLSGGIATQQLVQSIYQASQDVQDMYGTELNSITTVATVQDKDTVIQNIQENK